jgi:hypothetical protein
MSHLIQTDNSLLSLHRTCLLISSDYKDTRSLIKDDYLKDIFD